MRNRLLPHTLLADSVGVGSDSLDMMAIDLLAERSLILDINIVDRAAYATPEMDVGSDIGVVSGHRRVDGDSKDEPSLGQCL